MATLKGIVLLLVLSNAAAISQRGARPRRAGESCRTGQDLIVQALELLQADSKRSEVEDANQLLRRATDLCAESGEAWYYRSLVETRLNHAPQAQMALDRAKLYSSDALRDGLNPFVLAAPRGSSRPGPQIHQRWAMVIGIGHFSDPRIPQLEYTTADATAFRDTLVDPALGGFPPENVRLLTDADANLVAIKKSLNWLARSAAPDDLVVVYIASHGSPRSDDTAGANYIVAHDTELDPDHVDPDALYASALAMVDLSNAVATRLRSLRTAVFLDTCYSGGAITNSSKQADSVFSKAAVSNATLQHISQGAGRVIFAASRSDQESLESPKLQHGYFTYYLVEALRKDPAMPLSQVFAYVQQHVSQRVDVDYALYGMHQSPVLSQSADNADFALGAGNATHSALLNAAVQP
jgi:hypothetical protein